MVDVDSVIKEVKWGKSSFRTFKCAKSEVCISRLFLVIDSTLQGQVCDLLDLFLVDFGAIEMVGTSLVKNVGMLDQCNAEL